MFDVLNIVQKPTRNARERLRPGHFHQKASQCRSADHSFFQLLGLRPVTLTQCNPLSRTVRSVRQETGVAGMNQPTKWTPRQLSGIYFTSSIYSIYIDLFHPMKHHYRYEHAPQRMYLPSDVTARAMYRDYICRNGQSSYETYRKVARAMNISFTQLSGEECSKCSLHVQHAKGRHGLELREPSEHAEECAQCSAHAKHMDQAKLARSMYRQDADREWTDDEVVVSADMMKVTVLPIIPVKEAIFTQRLI